MSCGCPINIYNNVTGGSSYESDNIGSGIGVYSGDVVSGNTTTFQFKTLVAGANTTITEDTEEITISTTGDGGVTLLNQVGGGSQIAQSITGSTLNLRTLLGTGDVTLTQNANDVTINAPTSVSIGTAGQPVLAGLVGNQYQFRNIQQGNGINVADAGPNIVIVNASAVTQLGGGQQLIISNTQGLLTARTLLSGSGVAVATSGNNITFSTTSDLITGVNNLGTPGARVLSNITGGVINARSIRTTGPGLTINETLNTIDFTVPAYSITSASGGQSLVASGFTNAVIRSLMGGTAISLTSNANHVTINSSAANTVTNLGTLPGNEDVLVDVTSNSVRAKSLQPNGNIQISSDANHIYFRPLVNVTIPYSGKTILNTYISGNPQLADFLGFGNSVTVTSLDQAPATYPSLPNAFIGWSSPYRASIRNVRGICRFSIPTTITEELDIYSIIHKGLAGNPALEVIYFARIFTTTTNILVGDIIQYSYDPTVEIEVGSHLYLSFYAHRPDGLGNQNPIEFYTSSSMTLVTSDVI
jgi:hypothetical protein